MSDDDFDIDLEDDADLDDMLVEEPAEEEPADDASPDLQDATEICGGDAELGQMLIDLVMRLKG